MKLYDCIVLIERKNHENRKRNDPGVETRPRIDRTTKKRSVAMKRLIEIIDQFQDKLLALNDQRNEIDEDMEQDDAVLAASPVFSY